MAVPDWIWFVFIFAFGCCIGSFLNVVIYRLPRDKSLVSPPSACPACGKHIRFYDNIPLVSWLFLGRKCRYCKASISPRYFIIELLTGLIFLGLFILYFQVNLRDGIKLDVDGGWFIYLLHIIMFGAFIAASAIDLEYWVIPLSICWLVTAVGFIGSAVGVYIIDPALIRAYSLLPSASAETAALAVGAAIGLVISWVLLVSGLVKRSYETEDGGQTTENGGQTTEDGIQTTEDGGQTTEDGGQTTEDGRQTTENGGQTTEDGGQTIEDGRQKVEGGSEQKFEPVGSKLSEATATEPGWTSNGVNHRLEACREVVFLLPIIICSAAAYCIISSIFSIEARNSFPAQHPAIAGLLGSLWGYFVGCGVVWGIRIFGTLGFGKEAMGLGDVHLMGAAGAVIGPLYVVVAFFVAPFFGLAWAGFQMFFKKIRQIPYGPFLSLGIFVVIILHDWIRDYLSFMFYR